VVPNVGVNRTRWGDTDRLQAAMVGAVRSGVTQMGSVGDMFAHRSGMTEPVGDFAGRNRLRRRYVLERPGQQPIETFRIFLRLHQLWIDGGAEAVSGERR